MLSPLASEVACQHLESALGSRVCAYSLTAELAHQRADVDNLASALGDHARSHSLGHDESASQVDVDNLAELLHCHVSSRDTLDDAGVVHQDVDAATEVLLYLWNELLHISLVSNVEYISLCVDAERCVLLLSVSYQISTASVERDFRTSISQGLCDSHSYAIRAASYQCNLALQRELAQNVFVFHCLLFMY